MESNDDLTFKLLIIGDSACGKSSLLMRFADDEFDEDMGPTIGVDFKTQKVTISGEPIVLKLWDTAGQERFRTLTASYYRGAQGVILVYDVTRRETFEHIAMWLNEVDVYCNQPIVKMLVGNKIDLPRQVSTEDGRNFAQEHNMLFIEASAKTKDGVEQAFLELTEKIYDQPDLWPSGSRKDVTKLKQTGEGAPGGCC